MTLTQIAGPGVSLHVDAVVNKIGLQKFILEGHSMGGSVAIAYAGLHPERVAGFLLVDTGDARQIPEGQKNQYIKAPVSRSAHHEREDLPCPYNDGPMNKYGLQSSFPFKSLSPSVIKSSHDR